MAVLLTTGNVPARRQASYWQEMVSHEFVSARCVTAPVPSFDARIRSVELGDLKLYDVAAARPTTVIRAADSAASESSCYFFLGIQIEGVGVLEQAGRSVSLRMGDMAMYDTAMPFQLRFGAAHRMLVVRIPVDEVGSRLRGLGSLAGVAIPSRLREARPVFDLVTIMANLDPTMSLRSQSSLSTAFFDLLLDAVLRVQEPRRPATIRLEDAKRVAEAHLSDVGFTVADWATRLGISERYLRRLFTASAHSPAQYLWRQRLESAAEKLRDPRYREAAIIDVAAACGFSDSAHFSRSFRTAFGDSPREYRSAAHTDPSAGPAGTS